MEPKKDWQKGFELETLKGFAAIFKAAFKPHTYGAFGVPNERDVADLLSKGELTWTKNSEGQIEAVASVKAFKSGSEQQDFAQRSVAIRAGDVMVKAIAGTPEGCRRILLALIARVNATPLWVEAHQEIAWMPALLQELGFALACVKIAASSDLKGLWLRHRDPSERVSGDFTPEDVPALKLLQQDYVAPSELEKMLAELKAYGDQWQQHYSSYNKRKSWTAFALRGFDATDPGFIIKPAEMSKDWKEKNPERLKAPCEWTPAAEALPWIRAAAEALPGKPERVRLMKLASGKGELARHADITDREAGTKDGAILRVHIPLQSAPGCRFIAWELDGTRVEKHFPPGCLFYLDIRKPHSVVNESPIDRIHLVVDLISSPLVRSLFS